MTEPGQALHEAQIVRVRLRVPAVLCGCAWPAGTVLEAQGDDGLDIAWQLVSAGAAEVVAVAGND